MPVGGRATTMSTTLALCAAMAAALVVGSRAALPFGGVPSEKDMCSQSGDYCFWEAGPWADPSGHAAVETVDTISGAASAEACCAACEANAGCNAWTVVKQDKECRLLSRPTGRRAERAGECVSGAQARPNFVFSFPDTLRAEAFSMYGNKVANVTPSAAKLAAEGTVFNQAHVMHTQCSPSRCTMVTGRYMHLLGHRTQTHLVQDYEANYFRALKEQGYHVQYYGKNDMFSANAFNLSVSNWTSTIGYPSGSNAFKMDEPGYFSFLYSGSNSSGSDPSNSADYRGVVDAVAWMHDSPPEPFVLFLPSRGGHPPYGAPQGWHNKFSLEEVKDAIKLRPRNISGMPTYMSVTDGIPHFRNIATLPEDTLYQIQRVYLGMVAYTDWILGQLVDGVDTAPNSLADRTSIFFSSDHGDFGGDYGLVEKWPGSMADLLSHVPLIARIPGGAQGHVSQAPVQTADVLETMLDMAKVNASWVRFGKSLATQLGGGEGDMNRFVYSEGGFYFENEQMIEANECLSSCPKGLYCPRGQEEAQPNGSPRAVMVRNLTAKLVYRPTGVSELYDYTSDPRETVNLFGNPKYSALQNDLTSHLLSWIVLTSDVTPTVLDSRGPPHFPFPIPSDPWSAPQQQSLLASYPKHTDLLAINGVIED